MKSRTSITVLFSLLLLSTTTVKAQETPTHISVPAFTAYSMPVKGSWSDQEGMRFRENGITRWDNPERTVNFYGKVKTPGTLAIAVKMKAAAKGNSIRVSTGGKTFTVSVPAGENYSEVKVGTVTVKDSGFIHIVLEGARKGDGVIADISSLELSGAAVKGIHFNMKERKNSASVHLRYPFPATDKAVAFYNEVTVPEGADPIHSYFMACGFSRGYFGIQVNSPTERRVIFSIWDSGNEAVDRNKVADHDKVALLVKGEGVYADGFGNEGTGGHSHWVYNWKAGTTYRFLVTADPDTVKKTTVYTGYFYLPEEKQWKLISSFGAPKDGKYLGSLYSFVENFWGSSGHLARKAVYGNQYIQLANGSWKELTKTIFSYDATGRAGDRLDYGAGLEGNGFFLTNGGFKATLSAAGDAYDRAPGKRLPDIRTLPGK